MELSGKSLKCVLEGTSAEFFPSLSLPGFEVDDFYPVMCSYHDGLCHHRSPNNNINWTGSRTLLGKTRLYLYKLIILDICFFNNIYLVIVWGTHECHSPCGGWKTTWGSLFSPTMWASGIKHVILLSSKYLYPMSHLTSPSWVLLILSQSDTTPCLNIPVISS